MVGEKVKEFVQLKMVMCVFITLAQMWLIIRFIKNRRAQYQVIQ